MRWVYCAVNCSMGLIVFKYIGTGDVRYIEFFQPDLDKHFKGYPP